MPRVPVSQERVQTGMLPSFRQSAARATPEAFGAGVGRAIAGVGAQVNDLANKFQEERNVLKAKDAIYAATAAEMEFRRELSSKKGQAAVDFGEGAIAGGLGKGNSVWEKIRADATKGLTKNQIQKFDQAWIPQQIASVDATGRYITQQFRAQQDSSDSALIKINGEKYLQGYNPVHLDQALAANASRLKRRGLDDKDIKQQNQALAASFHAQAIESMVSKDDYKSVDDYMEEWGPTIPAETLTKLETYIKGNKKASEQDKRVANQRLVADAENAAMGDVEKYMNAVISGDAASLPQLRAAAQASIRRFGGAGEEAGISSAYPKSQRMQSVILTSEAKQRTAKNAAELDLVDAQASSLRIEMNAGVLSAQDVEHRAMELWSDADAKTQIKLGTTVNLAMQKEKDDIKKSAKIKDFDHSNAIRQMNGAMLDQFLKASGQKQVSKMSADQRVTLGAMQDDLNEYAKTHTREETNVLFKKMIAPIVNKATLKAAYSRYAEPPLDVSKDYEIKLAPEEERKAQATLKAIGDPAIGTGQQDTVEAPEATPKPKRPQGPKPKRPQRPTLQGLNAI